MPEQTKTFWITKYALTQGLFQAECELSDDLMVRVVDSRPPIYFHPGEYHETFTEAYRRAEILRAKKEQSLDTQISKLKGMHHKWRLQGTQRPKDLPLRPTDISDMVRESADDHSNFGLE